MYQADPTVEALVKKNTGNPFLTSNPPAKQGTPLQTENIPVIKKGSNDMFSAKADNYQADPTVEGLVKKNTGSPFLTSNSPTKPNDPNKTPPTSGIS